MDKRWIGAGSRVMVGLACVWCVWCAGCTTFSAATADPDPGDDVAPPQSCPTDWPPGTTTVPFNEPPPNSAAIASAPFGVFVQGTDGARGVPTIEFAKMISSHFQGGQLVMLGKADDLQPDGPYLKGLPALSKNVELALTLDVTHKPYQSVDGQLNGLEAFRKLVEDAPGPKRSISTLVYQKDGGKLNDTQLAELSQQMPANVDLAVFGGIGGATPAVPSNWQGSYTSMVEAYGLFSHSCGSKDAGLDILVDGPAGGESICGDTCDCTPAGTQSIYEACAGDPQQAGRIAGYLASLKAVPVGDSLDGVVFVFSFDPALDDPTIFPASWGPQDYVKFANAFAQMVAWQAKVTDGTIKMGMWDMTVPYSRANGWAVAD